MPGDRQASAYRRKPLLREQGRDKRAQVRGAHIPYIGQEDMGFRELVRGVQQIYELSGRELQREALQPAFQHEHILADVGDCDSGAGHGENRIAEAGGESQDGSPGSLRAPESGGTGPDAGRDGHL